MNIVDIIIKKREKKPLTKEEINYTIKNYVNGTISDYQMSSLLMAIFLNGMSDEETFYLTEAMLNSGDKIDLSDIEGIKVDKHSTGGIGDKTTLILAPLVASCGVIVPKMSGRSLGFTGGTIDKLESILNFNTSLTMDEFKNQIKNLKVAIASQTGNLVPADKKIYALRDVTGTVESIPLIASSIMSKKLAAGADKIVIDLKLGNGALVKDLESAHRLANLMTNIGKYHGKETICVITNMNEPLGCMIGNSLEIKESIEVLNGKGPSDLVTLVEELGAIMVSIGKNISLINAKAEVHKNLQNGLAYQKFLEMVKAQNGVIENVKISENIIPVISDKDGYIESIDAAKIGEIVRALGGGRYQKEDIIDPSVGIVLVKKTSDFVKKGEVLLKLYINEKKVDTNDIINCFKFSEKPVSKDKLIYEVIS